MRAGFDQLPITPGEMKGTPSFPAQLSLRLIGNPGVLHDTLASPSLWSSFANDEAFNLLVLIFQAAQSLHIPYNGSYHIPSGTTKRSAPLLRSRANGNPAQNLTSHAFEAIIGADNFIDIENHVVMKDVFDEIVDITRTVTPTCE